MSKRECDIDLYAGLSQVQSKLVALEARVAVAEKRLTALEIEPSDPDEAMPSGCFDCDATTCPCADPEPVPQWRASVDEDARKWADRDDSPLAMVLYCLGEIAEGERLSERLARIVAVAEGQVGDGWKADPDGIVLERVVQWLLGPLSRNDWRVLGNRAAAWLRSLTEAEQ